MFLGQPVHQIIPALFRNCFKIMSRPGTFCNIKTVNQFSDKVVQVKGFDEVGNFTAFEIHYKNKRFIVTVTGSALVYEENRPLRIQILYFSTTNQH